MPPWGKTYKKTKASKKTPWNSPSYWAKIDQEKARVTRELNDPIKRAGIIRDLSKKCLEGNLSLKKSNILLRALELEKKAQGESFSVQGDALIRWLRKDTNYRARLRKKPE
ncbi:MAG: hypothetical protein QXO69_00950 [archaeon]